MPREAAAILRRCLFLTLAMGLLELAAGLLTGSLSLVADAGHMLTDSSGLLLAFLAAWAVRRRERPAERVHPLEALAALANALLLLGLVAGLVQASLARLQHPAEVAALPALGVALLGLAVNLIVLRWLRSAQPTLNVRAAFWHVAGDLLGSLAAITSTTLLALGVWPAADSVLALGIAALLLVAALRLLVQSVAALRA